MSEPVPMPIVVARRVAGSVFILGLVVVLIGIALLANWWVTRPVLIGAPPAGTYGSGGSGSPSFSAPTAAASVTPTASRPPPKTAAQRERDALAELQRVAAADLSETYVSGQWVAQLSSKYVGVVDQRQKTKSGSNTFRAVDILDEYRAVRKRFSGRYEVRLLRGEDFYPYKTKNGKTFWYVFVLGDFGAETDVDDFCRSAYPKLNGKARENRCLPRELGG